MLRGKNTLSEKEKNNALIKMWVFTIVLVLIWFGGIAVGAYFVATADYRDSGPKIGLAVATIGGAGILAGIYFWVVFGGCLGYDVALYNRMRINEDRIQSGLPALPEFASTAKSDAYAAYPPQQQQQNYPPQQQLQNYPPQQQPQYYPPQQYRSAYPSVAYAPLRGVHSMA